ncbi:type II toxin-antitoxin system VapB family antitoxin [Xenophilus arseniciresistens]|uniref:Type II toxin-antitoxin system VapB family antitoxin n=1 Tax=Xenophilus arseniciresistens TaxID=1283306 RepID=A0AAE3N9V9_9BURK|nr:type II toxin-antitoxin system VapB family antitoxin [Xenophilus arseniciresistens]MDA7416966.1 type II toxin-antitoxin system VapB family antitoxin [Xenophilus arseniciresistens]
MRTNIVIDDKLMAAAMKAGGFATKKEAVEEGLRLLARRKAHQDLLALGGKLQWAGDDSVDWRTIPADESIPDAPVAERKVSKAKPRIATHRGDAHKKPRRKAAA